ncbi:hypothetical protein SNE40_011402 [Patella caerulea]|uniref:MAM domain-containing protein n=1 Tax=Patella caerulea TaxID=87958 RepID=A0AAN8JPT7_PATCE
MNSTIVRGAVVILAALIGTTTSNVSCDFEHDFCDWYQSKTDNLDWARTNLKTPDKSSGPYHDHSSGNGFYAYLSGSIAGFPNATAELHSPILIVTTNVSFEIWYHMNGIGIGNLKIGLINTTINSKTILWEQRGRRGVEWQHIKINLPKGTYKLCISATARLHYGSDVAIDDIKITGSFGKITVPPPTTTQETIYDVNEIACNFDQSFCHWYQDTDDQFDWRRTSLNTPDRTSGPSADHTTGDSEGYYAYINGHEILQPNSVSRMISPKFMVNANCSVRVWYHMNGHGIGSLSINKVSDKRAAEVLFKVTGRQGPDWSEARLDLAPGIYKLAIEGTVNLHYGSDIAIDDISVIKHTKPNIVG